MSFVIRSSRDVDAQCASTRVCVRDACANRSPFANAVILPPPARGGAGKMRAMPLSHPIHPRQRLHTRHVSYEGYQRDDGLIDIEGHLIDTKDRDLNLLSGVRPAGEPVHEMWVRVTIDHAFEVRDIEAHTDAMPYPGACDTIGPAYRALIGSNLVSGFRKRLHETMGHVRGCTHLTEMLTYLPTAAVQTFAGLRKREDDGEGKPFQLDRCHALETSSETVRRYYPKWYRRGA
jgi:hypothetical protein